MGLFGKAAAPPDQSRAVRLDALLAALQSEVSRAQRAIDARHQGRLQQMIDLDASGAPESLSYVFQVALPEGGAARVPLLTLRPHVTHQVTEVLLDLPVRIEDTKSATVLVVPPPPAPPGLHRLRIALRGENATEGEVTLGGLFIKRIGTIAP